MTAAQPGRPVPVHEDWRPPEMNRNKREPAVDRFECPACGETYMVAALDDHATAAALTEWACGCTDSDVSGGTSAQTAPMATATPMRVGEAVAVGVPILEADVSRLRLALMFALVFGTALAMGFLR